MFSRSIQVYDDQSFLLLGPRGTGKSMWIRTEFPEAVYIDLLESSTYTELLAAPGRLEDKVPPRHRGWVIIDEVQKVPALLDEVHRLSSSTWRRSRATATSSARSSRIT